MSLPYFFVKELPEVAGSVVLNEENSRHIIQVLRLKAGDQLWLLNGKGTKAFSEITDDHKKHCAVVVKEVQNEPASGKQISIAISLLKNAARFEWFLEKAVEIGATKIIPLVCARTETQKFRAERMQTIVISAMLQSQRLWLPEIIEPVRFNKFVHQEIEGEKFIAHCRNEEERNPLSVIHSTNSTILIGPEGDFTPEEINLALENKFSPVSLGDSRLRTETAGLVAATLLCR